MVEMLWEVAFADGNLDHFESNLISRIAGLIFVSDRDRGDAKHAGDTRSKEDALRAVVVHCRDAVVHWPTDVITVKGHFHVVGLVSTAALVGRKLDVDALDGGAANLAVPRRLLAVAEPKPLTLTVQFRASHEGTGGDS